MAKGSGGTRTVASVPKGYSYERETEKAVQVNLRLYAEYAPEGGFTSSLVKDRTTTQKVWLPKSQIRDGHPTNWILRTKANEIAESKTPLNGRVLSVNYRYTDSKGDEIKGVQSEKEEQWAKEQAQRTAENRKAGAAKAAQTRAANKGLRSSTKVATGSGVSSARYGQGTIQRVITKSSGYVQVRYNDGTVRKEMAYNLKGEDGKPLRIKPKSNR